MASRSYSMFPPIEFHPDYSEHDRKLYKFLIHSSIREFHRKLLTIGFEAFTKHPVSRISVTPHDLGRCRCLGLVHFQLDEIELRLPIRPSGLQVSVTSGLITHELGHHIIQEYFGDSGEGNRIGNNLIHWEANRSDTYYRYNVLFNSFVFVRKYFLPFCRVPFPDVRRLIFEKEMIIRSIKDGTAPIGIHVYWT